MAQFSAQNLKKIGVYTSGGDAPGMNAAIRAVVRTSISMGFEVMGIQSGYVGMIEGQFLAMNLRSVANILQRGGTVIKTGRSLEFTKPEGRTHAVNQLKKAGIDALVCIGGDGSFRGAHLLWEEHQIPVVGLPGTIDNDIWGTDDTIGFDTAVNTALEAIDKIRDTADSHDRVFVVEVMGRNTGFIASYVGLAGGASEIFTPDIAYSIDHTVEHIKSAMKKGKLSSILVAAEGQKPGRAYDLADQLRKKAGVDAKVCILGHQQRGGAPTANDRILASRLGVSAVQKLVEGQCDIMCGVMNDKLVFVPLEDAIKKQKTSPIEYVKLAQSLSV